MTTESSPKLSTNAWLGAPLRLWRGRLWWLYAVAAFLIVPALLALLIRTAPSVPGFAYTIK